MNQSIELPSEQEMRGAIAKRDPAYDGRFIFGVVTTGIFCRPVCSSRPAKPENLRFFNDAASASAAGFRACKRCKPQQSMSRTEALIETARYIEANAEQKLILKDLAARADLSPSRFQRAFKQTFGVTPKAYQDAVKLKSFKSSLKHGESVTNAIFDSGFGSTSRVYGEPARRIGMKPKAYRKGGEGENIAYAFRKTNVGPLLMAATDKGVCFAQFGDSQAELIAELTREFPRAELIASTASTSPALDDWINALNAYLDADAPLPELPLDLRGTAFQIKVWRFLCQSNAGETLSYSALAEGIKQPRATRAAASACGANRVAILVPCHRVLRADGGIGGYRWGIERKRDLLAREQRAQL